MDQKERELKIQKVLESLHIVQELINYVQENEKPEYPQPERRLLARTDGLAIEDAPTTGIKKHFDKAMAILKSYGNGEFDLETIFFKSVAFGETGRVYRCETDEETKELSDRCLDVFLRKKMVYPPIEEEFDY